jgi:hypothetical protein
MTSEPENQFRARRVLSQQSERLAERRRPTEIVGEIGNPVLEAVRRFWWRGVDRLRGCFVSLRLSILNRIYGLEPPTPADLKREADRAAHSACSAAGKAVEPDNDWPQKNQGGK